MLGAARGAFDNYSATAVFFGAAGGSVEARAPRRWLRVALAALAALCLGLAVQRCLGRPEAGLVFGTGAARALPVGEEAHGAPAGVRLHSHSAQPRH